MAHGFDADGVYIYKRPVRSAAPQHQALLSQAGSVFHHVVLYVKRGDDLKALEFGPANGMDVTDNMLAEAPAGSVLVDQPELPQAEHLPMLHIKTPHHPLKADHVQRAVRFAEGRVYQAMHNNCIAFADFIVRVLTGGRVRSAPLLFDALCGTVPPVDSPLLPVLQMMTQLTWFDVTDGSRLMRHFLAEHGHAAVQQVPATWEGIATGSCAVVQEGRGMGSAAEANAPTLAPAVALASAHPENQGEESSRSADTAGAGLLQSSAASKTPKGGLTTLPQRRRLVSRAASASGCSSVLPA